MFAVVSDNIRATDGDRNNTCQALDAALGDGQLSTEEHRQRVSAATKATTLSELHSLISDLQIQHTPVEPAAPASKVGSPVIWIAGAAALVLLLLGAGFAVMQWNRPSGTSAPSLTTSPAAIGSAGNTASATPQPQQLLSFAGMTGLLAQMRTQFGDTLGYQLNVYQDQAVVLRPDTANARKVVTWVYRDGNWMNLGPTPAALPNSAVGDLAKFDVQAVLGVVQQAPQTLHIYDANRTTLTIESRKDGSLSLRIHASDGPLSGSIAVGTDGSVIQVSPPAR
ncbi:membrane protein [Mycobacterium lentiflavum]|uniref:Membrane protein n=1 Tax=Mycobacterium lentiflavum TaxID=141349 RepID=A0A0E3WB07_MYCLN|nr:membrane protein [Mycobacterium lentiflavum]